MQNKSKGITLIALVITIIVLLILAGVAIATLTGENGVLTKAGNSKLATEQAQILEQLRLEMYERKVNVENELTELQYLKEKGIIKQEITEPNEIAKYASINDPILIAEEDTNTNATYYIIDVTKLISSPTTGKGDWENGDVYYLSNGDLYYRTKDRESENKQIGKVFEFVEETTEGKIEWIWEENAEGNIDIVGINLTGYTDNYPDEVYSVDVKTGIKSITVPSYIADKKVVSVKWEWINWPYDSYSSCNLVGVEEIVYGDTIEEISWDSIGFRDAVRIQLPSELKDLQEVYRYGAKLNEIVIEGSSSFVLEDGVLYNVDKTKLFVCPRNKDKLEIPDTVVEICPYAFSNCKELTQVTLSLGLKVVEFGAFNGCSSLVSISVPESTEEIGSRRI